MAVNVIDNSGGFQQRGHKLEVICDVTGSSNYVSGTGQAIQASDVMMSAIEHICAGVSTNGTYFVLAKTAAGNTAQATMYLVWYLSSTGAEYGGGDLSTSTVRLHVKGY